MKHLRHLSLWFDRFVLLAAALILALIGSRYIADPVGAAATTDISLGSALAISTMRVGFGAFPLGCALVALTCLLSPSRLRTGLFFVAVIFGVALAVRVFAILDDGTLKESLSLLSAEALLLTLSIVGLVLNIGQQRQGSREAM
jgi:hypothetical protein